MIVSEIKEGSICQGDLVFILHNTKAVKSGWWRKVRQGEAGDKTVIYVLERPVHKDFNLLLPEIKRSRVELGVCAMSAYTLKEGIDEGKYDVILDIRGTDQTFLLNNNYEAGCINLNIIGSNSNIFVTEEGLEFIKLCKSKGSKKSRVENLVDNIR